MWRFLLLLVVFTHISIEIDGLLVFSNIKNGTTEQIHEGASLYHDVPSLVQNPNIRTKPNHRYRKDDDCSDELLRKVMNEHMSETGMSESKRAIHNAAKRDFEGSWSVICAPCAFSYLTHTQEFCIHSRYGVTCLLYRDA